ncbi:hypothetical protein J437_LFUL009901 [Ladona fulva]|uniref:BHLH domain-containing protein n=1 Tax=Ladona fulva TaxID=123851 RepID=A0A8K0K7H8_LADFU|nr:hypothetical protein J437_LFUL009901 [Ladona fulva]
MTLGPSPQKNSPTTCVLLSSAPVDSSSPQKMSVLLPAKRASPAGEAPTNPSANTGEMLRCKRRITFSGSVHPHIHHHQPASVARRNARERNRVKQVNNGFATLRQHIPMSLILAATSERSESPSDRSGRCSNSAAAKKMSKVETLRCAVEYIRSLQTLLESENPPPPSPQASVSSEGALGSQGSLLGGFYGHDFTSSEGSPSPTYQFPVQAPPPSSLSSPPPSSTSSSASPSPSYGSDETPMYTPSNTIFYNSHNPVNTETYEPMSPEDEELLDVISWWQQSQ